MEAASVGGLFHFNQACNVAYWHFASIRTRALNGRYWGKSGHWPELALNASVANDPTATFHRVRLSPTEVIIGWNQYRQRF
jgi:hypothetical protein